jgi:hypothetical protein
MLRSGGQFPQIGIKLRIGDIGIEDPKVPADGTRAFDCSWRHGGYRPPKLTEVGVGDSAKRRLGSEGFWRGAVCNIVSSKCVRVPLLSMR